MPILDRSAAWKRWDSLWQQVTTQPSNQRCQLLRRGRNTRAQLVLLQTSNNQKKSVYKPGDSTCKINSRWAIFTFLRLMRADNTRCCLPVVIFLLCPAEQRSCILDLKYLWCWLEKPTSQTSVRYLFGTQQRALLKFDKCKCQTKIDLSIPLYSMGLSGNYFCVAFVLVFLAEQMGLSKLRMTKLDPRSARKRTCFPLQAAFFCFCFCSGITGACSLAHDTVHFCSLKVSCW